MICFGLSKEGNYSIISIIQDLLITTTTTATTATNDIMASVETAICEEGE